MAMKLSDTGSLCDNIVLSTGRNISANHHILGLPAFGKLLLTEGYDGCIENEDGQMFWDRDDRLTFAERTEIAEHMIGRWREWVGDDTDTTQDRGDQGIG